MTKKIEAAISEVDLDLFYEEQFNSSKKNNMVNLDDGIENARKKHKQELQEFLDSKASNQVWLAKDKQGNYAGLIWAANRGFSDAWDPDPDPAWVYDIKVDPAHRRAGLGRQLLKTAEEWAADQGFQQIGLHVFAGNLPAINLYLTNQFKTAATYYQKVIPKENQISGTATLKLIEADQEDFKAEAYQFFADAISSHFQASEKEMQERYQNHLQRYGFFKDRHHLMWATNPDGKKIGGVWFYPNKPDPEKPKYVWVQDAFSSEITNLPRLYNLVEDWAHTEGINTIKALRILPSDKFNQALENNQYKTTNLFMQKALTSR
jgi:ribosomal protein S18 acetylase RimI-like enzyme